MLTLSVVCDGSSSAIAVGTLAPAAYAYLIGRGRGPVVHTLGENTVRGDVSESEPV